MKHLRKFNENSHDWRANAFHGAPDEEIDKMIGLDADHFRKQTDRDFHGSKSDVPKKKKTEAEVMADYEEDWNYWRSTSSTTGAIEPILNDYLRSAGLPVKEEPKTVEPEVEPEEEKPNVGSRIKNFFGFGKK